MPLSTSFLNSDTLNPHYAWATTKQGRATKIQVSSDSFITLIHLITPSSVWPQSTF